MQKYAILSHIHLFTFSWQLRRSVNMGAVPHVKLSISYNVMFGLLLATSFLSNNTLINYYY